MTHFLEFQSYVSNTSVLSSRMVARIFEHLRSAVREVTWYSGRLRQSKQNLSGDEASKEIEKRPSHKQTNKNRMSEYRDVSSTIRRWLTACIYPTKGTVSNIFITILHCPDITKLSTSPNSSFSWGLSWLYFQLIQPPTHLCEYSFQHKSTVLTNCNFKSI